MLRSDFVSAAFLLDGYNCWRVRHGANTLGRFGDDLLDQRNDRAANLRVFDSSVCLYQCHPIGRCEKSTHVPRYRIATFCQFREMKLARRPLKEKRHRYTKDVRQLMKTAGADAVGALLVFLNLLEGQFESICQLHLSEVEHKSTHADAGTNVVVYRVRPPAH
jgi:hypothetical protein